MLGDLPSLVDTEIADDQLGWLECSVPVAVRDIDSRVAEPDYVCSFVAGQVRNETGVLGVLPSLVGPVVGDREGSGTESAVPFVQRDVYSSTAITNDVDLSITSQVSEEAGVLRDTPARAVAEIVDDGLGGREGSVPVVAANEHVVLAESYDVWTTISGGVTDEAQVSIEAPTSSVVAEVLDSEVGGIEFRIAIVPRDEDSGIPKSNNVASSDSSNVT